MPIDISNESLITLTQAAQLLPGRPAASTTWRWHRRGIRGVRLETVVIGGRRYTSLSALERFVARTTAASDNASMPLSTTSRRRQAELRRVERELDEQGI